MTRSMLSGKTWQTFPSLRQVLASWSCSSTPTPGPAGPICDVDGCRSRILSAHSRLTSNQLGLMNDGNATGSTFCKRFCPPFDCPLYAAFFSISINYYRIALITLVQLLRLKLKMKHVLPGIDAVLENLCSLLRAFCLVII